MDEISVKLVQLLSFLALFYALRALWDGAAFLLRFVMRSLFR